MRKVLNMLLIMGLFVALLASPSGASAYAGSTATGGLAGQVTGLAGRPLAGAAVELYQFGAGRVDLVETQADGSFRFTLPDDAQAYWVRVRAAGYRFTEATWIPGSDRFLAIAPEPLAGTTRVRLVDAESGLLVQGGSVDLEMAGRGQVAQATQESQSTVLTVEAGHEYQVRAAAPGYQPALLAEKPLEGGAVRNRTIELVSSTGLVTGTVASALDGSAVADAQVQVLRTGYGVVAGGSVGARDGFRFSLPSGAEYQVLVSAPDRETVRTERFVLAAGGVRDFSGEERLLLEPSTGEIFGTLYDLHEDEIPNATVLLERKPFGTIAATQTDASGRFRFAGLPVADGAFYRVRFESGRDEVDFDQVGSTSAWMPLQNRVPNRIVLQSSGTRAYFQAAGSIAGTVATAAGTAVSGATVQLWNDALGLVATETTGENGRFRFPSVSSNTMEGRGAIGVPYYLKVIKSGMFTTTLAGDAAIDVVSARETVANVTLYPTAIPVSGRVVDDEGTPLAKAGVTLVPTAGVGSLQAETDQNGRWHLDAADPLRTYRVTATADGSHANTAADLTPDPTGISTRDLTLYARSATLSGQVGDRFGNPVPGARVSAWSPARLFNTETDADGRYRFQVPAGQTYHLAAALAGAASGLGPDGRAVPLSAPAPGQLVENDLTLWSDDAVVVGTVLYVSGAPAAWLKVELVREGAQTVLQATTDGRGAFRFEGLTPGVRYAVQVPGRVFRDAEELGLPALITTQPATVENVHLTVLDSNSP